jgi:hypothetical protein
MEYNLPIVVYSCYDKALLDPSPRFCGCTIPPSDGFFFPWSVGSKIVAGGVSVLPAPKIFILNEERKQIREKYISDFEKEIQRINDEKTRTLIDFKSQIEQNEKIHLRNRNTLHHLYIVS